MDSYRLQQKNEIGKPFGECLSHFFEGCFATAPFCLYSTSSFGTKILQKLPFILHNIQEASLILGEMQNKACFFAGSDGYGTGQICTGGASEAWDRLQKGIRIDLCVLCDGGLSE